MNVVARVFKKVVEEVTTPESYRKGDEFVDFVRNKLFPKDEYRLLHRTPNYITNKNDFIESTYDPDLKLKSRTTGKIFFVEAKYRSTFYNGTIEWCKDYQFARYRELNSRIPVYLAMGIGGHPDNPEQAYLIPVSDIKYRTLFRSFLKPYGIDPNHYVGPRSLFCTTQRVS